MVNSKIMFLLLLRPRRASLGRHLAFFQEFLQTKFILMQISIIVLIFLFLFDKPFDEQKSLRGGGDVSVEESQSSKSRY